MISHKHKFIFTHIPKTGGSSVHSSLNDYFEPNQWMHNDLQKDLKKCSSDYFKFAFVRNPWDLTVSSYHYFCYSDVTKWRRKKIPKNFIFKDWLRWKQKNRSRGWKKNRCYGKNQLCYVSNIRGELLADFIGRFENLQKDFNTICDKIGIPHQELPHKNATKHKHYTEYYDEETKQIVAERYANDIEYFNYEFGE